MGKHIIVSQHTIKFKKEVLAMFSTKTIPCCMCKVDCTISQGTLKDCSHLDWVVICEICFADIESVNGHQSLMRPVGFNQSLELDAFHRRN